MESTEKPENQTRTQEIRIIWKQHQWLYIIVGFIIGLLFTALIQVNTTEFFLNLIPEALGIGFGVFVVDRLYRHWQRHRILNLIKKELIFNLSQLMMKNKSVITPSYTLGMPVRSMYGKNEAHGTISVRGRHIKWLFMYIFVGTKSSQLRTVFIEDALTSDILLLLGNAGSSKEITIHEALLELRNLIDKRKYMDENLLKQSREYLDDLSRRVQENEMYQIPNMDIITPMVCIDLDINIIGWSQHIIASIDAGKSTVTIPTKLQPTSPIEKEAQGVSEETPQPSEIEEWISNWKFDW
jgi:hypothetical protein